MNISLKQIATIKSGWMKSTSQNVSKKKSDDRFINHQDN